MPQGDGSLDQFSIHVCADAERSRKYKPPEEPDVAFGYMNIE